MDAYELSPPFEQPGVDSARLRSALDYWRAKRREGRLPSRADLDPLELKPLLPFLYLIDVLGEPRRFRYRLIGTQVVRWSGDDGTGRFADDEFCGSGRFELIELYERTARSAMPVVTPWQSAVLGGSMMRFARLLLPLAADGRSVDMLMGVADELSG